MAKFGLGRGLADLQNEMVNIPDISVLNSENRVVVRQIPLVRVNKIHIASAPQHNRPPTARLPLNNPAPVDNPTIYNHNATIWLLMRRAGEIRDCRHPANQFRHPPTPYWTA